MLYDICTPAQIKGPEWGTLQMDNQALMVEIAKAIYFAAFDPIGSQPGVPSPGWAWEKTSEYMRQFAMRQAAFAIEAIERNGYRIMKETSK